MRFVWTQWKLHRKMLKAKVITVSGQMSRHAIRRRAFVAWRISQERRERQRALQILKVALPHSVGVLYRYYLQRWINFVDAMKLDREIQLRSDLTWSKVQGWMVDTKGSHRSGAPGGGGDRYAPNSSSCAGVYRHGSNTSSSSSGSASSGNYDSRK